MQPPIDYVVEKLQECPNKTFKELREQQYPITTLIGSSKWPEDFRTWTAIWGLLGHQVWSICIAGHRMSNFDMMSNAKRQLDAAYMAKIERSDQVFVVNDANYTGLGTMDELLYALALGKDIGFSERFKDLSCAEGLFELAKREGYENPEPSFVSLPSYHSVPGHYLQDGYYWKLSRNPQQNS